MSAQPQEALGTIQERCAEGIRQHRAGNRREAERLYREVLAVDPRQADSLQLLGVLATEDGRYQEAIDLTRRALEIAPKHASAYHNLGNALLGSGRASEALVAYNLALQLHPRRAATHYGMANALSALGQLDDAIAQYRAALALNPAHASAYNNLGNALERQGRREEAIRAYLEALEHDPAHAQACNNLANALKDQGRAAQALTFYERSASLGGPSTAATLANKALLLMEMGEITRSLHATEQALGCDPTCIPAWHVRAQLKRFAPDDPDIGSMEALLASATTRGIPVEEEIRLEFALGKALLDGEQVDRAFAHFQRGNRLKRATLSYDAQASRDQMMEIARAFSPELLRQYSSCGYRTDRPVFIVGMPRSGTTLVEQILASHGEVYGAGELQVLPDLAAGIGELCASELLRIGRAYEEQLPAPGPSTRRVVDKMPANFLYVGLIHLALPNARIIHCRRDPADTCLSCYMKTFRGKVDYAYDLRELGLYYQQYAALMAHWHALLPSDRLLTVRYEDVLQDVEHEARRLVDFCGLSWDPACVDFHITRRQIQTASATQVIRPIYRTSVGRAQRFAAYLEPLLAVLNGGAADHGRAI